jgi:hypothetical protein
MTNKEYQKQYYQANKERLKQYAKGYYQDNSESKKQYIKQWNQSNPEYQKQYFESAKLPHHIVYLLPDHNYVGVTDNPHLRMNWHKNKAKRNIDNWIELARYTDREEALVHEARLHAEGYEGAKAGYNITQEA